MAMFYRFTVIFDSGYRGCQHLNIETKNAPLARRSIMPMRDITELMNAYRECSRNLWNVYFSKRKDIGDALDVFEQIRELLFDSIILSELSYEGEAEGEDIPPPVLRVVPGSRSLILIQRLGGPGRRGTGIKKRIWPLVRTISH